MNNKDKKEYCRILEEYNFRQAYCFYRSQLNAVEELQLKWHLAALKLMYLLRKNWFSWKRFTKFDW